MYLIEYVKAAEASKNECTIMEVLRGVASAKERLFEGSPLEPQHAV